MSTSRRTVAFLVLSLTGGVVFQVAYIRFVYLGDTARALDISIQEYGNVTSVFGAVAVVMYFVGGWFADRFSPKRLIVVALVGTGAVDLYLATVPGVAGIVVAHVLFAVFGMGLYWSALVKSIGMLGSPDQQGRLFGFLEGTRGLASTVVGFVGSAVVAAAVVASDGVLTLMRLFGVLCFVFAVLVAVLVRQDEAERQAAARQTVTLGELLSAARNRYTWLIGGTIMAMYCFYTLLGYLTPLLQNGFGVAAAAVGVIGVIRTYVFQFVAGPVGGILADKATRSTPRYIRLMFVVAGAAALAFLLLPHRPALIGVAFAITIVLCFAVFSARGVYWATVGEVGVPAVQRGGVIGLASGLAYLPDAFLPSVGAWWVGDPANGVAEQGGGFTALFAFLIGAAVVGFVLTTLTLRQSRRPGTLPSASTASTASTTERPSWTSATSPSTSSRSTGA
ncbi:MFS transporter [Frondihabitans peucedani]|uniref:MFS transporter n=1 Tax=Frondihabitans peucedani TaxID=598626 RepID=A0ABP8E1L2_9MICO